MTRRQRNQKRRNRLKEIVAKAKENPCSDCGLVYPSWVMQFDHLRDKIETIPSLVRAHSLPRLLAEMEKCELVCASCHKVRTYERGQFRHGIKQKIEASVCSLCFHNYAPLLMEKYKKKPVCPNCHLNLMAQYKVGRFASRDHHPERFKAA